MKRSKGFTLIELLAVIVILAIIALIVTPVVSGIITSARNSANARSVEGHIRNVELAIVTDAFATGAGDLAIYDRTNGVLPSGLTIPTNDKITCESYTVVNGQVTEATKCADYNNTANWHHTYRYTPTEGAVIEGELGGSSNQEQNNNQGQNVSQQPSVQTIASIAHETGETHKGIVYLDPSDTSVECNSSSTITTTNTGCKKFYIFDDNGDTYKMIMDRNTTAKVAWNSTNSNSEMKEVATSLANDTAGWIGSPRLITAEEIASIVDNSSWTNNGGKNFYFGSKNTKSYSSQNDEQKAIQRSYHWLFDYTSGCTSYGCGIKDNSATGYWTSTAVSDYLNYVWYVGCQGTLNASLANSYKYYGVRPVIEISKDLID